MTKFVGIIICALNWLLCKLIISTIYLYGYDSLTKTCKVSKLILAKISFFNKCVLLILITANFEFTDT